MSLAESRPPSLSKQLLSEVVCEYFNFKSVDQNSIKSFPSYDDRNYYFQGQPLNGKYLNSEFVLKINNPAHTPFETIHELNAMMNHVNSCGFQFSAPSALESRDGGDCVQLTCEELTKETVNGDCSVQGKQNGDDCDQQVNSGCKTKVMRYSVRVLTFIPGELFDNVEKKFLTPILLRELGEMVGNIDKELKNFTSDILKLRHHVWDLKDFLSVETFVDHIDDPKMRSNAETVFKYFKEHVVPKLPSFTKTIIHCDMNGLNIVLRRKSLEDAYSLVGVIDFGDCLHSCTVFDLAICLAYVMTENLNPVHCSSVVEFVGPLVSGYNSILPLTPEEFDSLYYLVLTRCIQSAVYGFHCFKVEPWNDYLLTTPNKACAVVELLLATSKEVVDRIWKTFL